MPVTLHNTRSTYFFKYFYYSVYRAAKMKMPYIFLHTYPLKLPTKNKVNSPANLRTYITIDFHRILNHWFSNHQISLNPASLLKTRPILRIIVLSRILCLLRISTMVLSHCESQNINIFNVIQIKIYLLFVWIHFKAIFNTWHF